MITIWYIFGVLAIGLLILFLISRPRKLSEKDFSIVLHKWKDIEAYTEEKRMKEALMEADKLVDFVLKRLNLRGKTFAERLKLAKPLLTASNYQALWEAHKLRNKLVHEIDFHLADYHGEQAIDAFYNALKNLKAL
ncbi:hypothetical protein KKE14_02535 [Patescibacteria group bacterium]|nr:hypothetical protein [Patescibacteria group bacterium]